MSAISPNTLKHFVNFNYRFASRQPGNDVYPAKSRAAGGLPWEGFEKAAWLHHTTGIPATWIVDSVALEQAGRRLRQFIEVFGDEVVLNVEAFAEQPFYKKIGVVQKPFGLRTYSFDDLVKIFHGYRELAFDVLGKDIKVIGGYHFNATVVQAAHAAGIEGIWGLCWDQHGCDGTTHRGSPWFPYYASQKDFKAPAKSKSDGPLLLPWYRADLGNALLFSTHAPFTTHSGELVRWNYEYPAKYIQAMLEQGLAEAQTSPFSFTNIHLECDWFDSSGIYNDEEASPATEVWAFQKAFVTRGIDPALGTLVSFQDFIDWHRANHPDTTRHQLDWKDPFGNFPDLRFTADTESFQIQLLDGTVIARQDYSGGKLGTATEGFTNRKQLRNSLNPNPKLPVGLQNALKLHALWHEGNTGGVTVLNPNVVPE